MTTRYVTKEEMQTAKNAKGHALAQIFLHVVDNLGLGNEGLAYLKSIIADGGIDFTNKEELAALDYWCLHTYDMSDAEDERIRKELYLALVEAGYPPKWHGALLNEVNGYDKRTPVPVFIGLL